MYNFNVGILQYFPRCLQIFVFLRYPMNHCSCLLMTVDLGSDLSQQLWINRTNNYLLIRIINKILLGLNSKVVIIYLCTLPFVYLYFHVIIRY